MRRGVFYTRNSVFLAAKAVVTLKINSLRSLARLPELKLLSKLEQSQVTVLDEVQVNLADKQVVYVSNSSGRHYARQIGRLMASQNFN